ncbi:MAG: hypothetical protein ABH838_01505 [Actinomycetota bacterium]
MDTEPEVNGASINKSFKNFLIAIIVLVFVTAGSVYGLYRLAALYPEKLPWAISQRNPAGALPDDIPLYRGAVLSESSGGSNRQTYTYVLQLGARSTARAFYEEEMPKSGWLKIAGGGTYLSFHKDEGRRRVMIRVIYTKGRATLEFEITTKDG